MNPEKCFCGPCSNNIDAKSYNPISSPMQKDMMTEIIRLRRAVAAAIEVAYDPGKQPAMVLALIDLGFIHVQQFPTHLQNQMLAEIEENHDEKSRMYGR